MSGTDPGLSPSFVLYIPVFIPLIVLVHKSPCLQATYVPYQSGYPPLVVRFYSSVSQNVEVILYGYGLLVSLLNLEPFLVAIVDH
jgi:hypothetical protein